MLAFFLHIVITCNTNGNLVQAADMFVRPAAYF